MTPRDWTLVVLAGSAWRVGLPATSSGTDAASIRNETMTPGRPPARLCVRRALDIAALIAGFSILAGCSTPGGGYLNTNVPADAGNEPAKYEATIQAYLRETLKDPYSIQDFSVTRPERSSCAVGIYGPHFGWRVDVSYNAKNSYGAYVGLQTYYFWFHGERIEGITTTPALCPDASAWPR